MLTKGGSNLGGSGDRVATSSIIDGFSNAFAVPGTSTHATSSNNNNIMDMDGFLVGLTGDSSSFVSDPISTLRPQLRDMELRRRARNNAILAKIQELEANACVQAARSERLRMMREEYENLVRKYASSQKSHWGTTSNGYLKENNNNGFPPTRYLQPLNSPLQQPNPPTQQLCTTTNTHPFPSRAQPTRDIPSNINPNFSTTGVNTDITGPVQSVVVVSRDDNAGVDDLQQVLNLERRKVATIIDSYSQTESHLQGKVAMPKQQMGVQGEAQCENLQTITSALLPSSSSTAPVYGTKANQGSIVENGEDAVKKDALSLKQSKNLPSKVEMMLMMLDEEDDESSYQAEERRKQQFENFRQQLHQQPKPHLRDDTNSISSQPSNSLQEVVSTSNNTTEEVGFKQRHRQNHQMEKASAGEHEKKSQKKGTTNKDDEMKDETSPDTTTISLANNKTGNNRELIGVVAADAAGLPEKIFHHDDISLSDSTSAFQTRKNGNERKKLLEQLGKSSTKNSEIKSKRKSDGISSPERGRRDADGDLEEENSRNYDSSENVEKERSTNKQGTAGVDDTPDFSSPTAGATSESIGDSMMDSIQKTPDARDDSELHEIEEVNEREYVVSATAVSSDMKIPRTGGGMTSKPFRVQPGVNDRVSVERKAHLKQDAANSTQSGVKDLEVYERQINDAEEIRPNNLSSSKVDVPAEEEEEEEERNSTHANNPREPNTGITTINGITFQEEVLPSSFTTKMSHMKEKKLEKEENLGEAVTYLDVEHSKMDKTELVHKNSGFAEFPFQEKQIVSGDSGSGDTGGVNELNKKKGTTLHSPDPSANMAAHSSTTSSFSSVSNVVDNGGTNETAFPPSIPSSTNLFQNHSSTGSSSTSSSRQHSLDDQNGNEVVAATSNPTNVSQTKEQSSSGSLHGSPQVKAIHQHQAPTLPQSVHKRHQQLQEQVRKEREEKETTPPVGADVMPEQLLSSSDSSFSKAPELEAEDTTNNAGDAINARKVSTQEKGGTSQKTMKGSSTNSTTAAFTIPTLTSSPSMKRIGNASNYGGNTVSGNGTGASASIRPVPGSRSAKSSNLTMKQGQSSSSSSTTAVAVPSGPTGAQNTARRVRLKLHEDSDTDSSEIGVVKSQPVTLGKGNISGSKGNSSNFGSGQKSVSINNKSTVDTNLAGTADKKPTEVDDDFDDFFDNF